jgi:hypothetical protein
LIFAVDCTHQSSVRYSNIRILLITR